MNRYPLWKNLLVAAVVLFGIIYALPNLFDQDPSMEVSGSRRAEVDSMTEDRVLKALTSAGIAVKSADLFVDKMLARFGIPDSERSVLFPLVNSEEAADEFGTLPHAVQDEALDALIEAAAADGKLAEEEREYLQAVARVAGVSEDQLEARCQRALGGSE